MLPIMQRTPSDSFPSDVHGHGYVPPKSRIALVQSAIRAFLINVRNNNLLHRVRLFLFNHQTEMVQGSTEELQSRMDAVRADNGTDMILCFQQMKKAYDLLTSEDQERIVCGILTDGMHNTHEDNSVNIDDVLKDPFYNKLFRSIIGIGHRDTVDYDVLTKLTGGRPDVFHLVSEESVVFDTMNGAFFDMLTCRVTDASFSVLCHNDETLVNMANVQKTYYTEEEYQLWKSRELPACTFMQLTHHQNTFVLDYVDSDEKEERAQAPATVPREFWLGIDVSGSMDTPVMEQDGALLVATDKVVQPASTHPYVKVTMPVSSVSQHTHLLGCGTVLGSIVQYMNPSTKVMAIESIPCREILENNITMDFGKTIVSLSDTLSKPMKKKQVQELYRNHLYLPQLLESEDIPHWMQAQGKVVWKNLKQRFLSTLSHGEQFFHQTPIAYDLMLRAVSSEASTQSATPYAAGSPVSVDSYVVPEEEIHKCKLCFDKNINVLFPDCRHAGLCKDCYTSYLDTTGKHNCPFCRKEVLAWSSIEVTQTKNGYCQEEGCYEHCDYVGHAKNEQGKEICGHLLYCKGCKSMNKTEEGVVCKECKNTVQTVRIYMC